MNRVGMVVDLSHVGERTSLDAIAFSARPVAITHSNPASFRAHPRNKSDQVLKALAESSGVLGCSPYAHLTGQVTLEQFCDMIARTVDLMGIEHVGIGSDMARKHTFEHLMYVRMGRWTHEPEYGAGTADNPDWAPWPDWFNTSADFPNFTAGLLARGFSEAEVAAVMGGNWLRLFSDGFEPA
jgi:microsomal dipeptidase-like Zn-dependent dipeptidase